MSHHHCRCESCCCEKKQGCCQQGCCQNESCQTQGSCCGSSSSCCSNGGKCDYKNKFLALANEAWVEVLKEKIKDNIRKDSQHLDELARLISEGNKEIWRHKMEGHRTMGSYEEKMSEFFNCCSSSSCGVKKNHKN